MSELTLARLRAEGERFTEELSRESFLAHAGLKVEAELAPIYRRYEHVSGPEALEFTLDLFHSTPAASDECRSARTLLEWQVDANVSRALVELEEREIAWESSAMISVAAGRAIPYQRAPIEIANAADRAERHVLDDARARAAGAEHAPLRRERLQRERELVESFGIAEGYMATFEALTGVSLEKLRAQCAAFLRDTQSMWDDVLPRFLKRSLGVAAGAATRADALRLFRAAEFDAGFPARALASAVNRQVVEMGLDPTAGGRIIYDLDEREGKRSRAFCAPVRVPDEVYLVLRPHGGQSDYTTLLHELGHALHFAHAASDLPFEFRWLGDNSVTETYAMLFDHRMHDRGWLRRYTQLGKRLDGFRRMMAFEELHFIRRYCAKLLYEMDVYGHAGAWDGLADNYVEQLSAATGFTYRPEDAFIDLDPGFYSARYLRAWQLQALLNDSLTENFNDDWYRNPASGPWLAGDLLARGQRDTADEIARQLGGELSFEPLQRAVERGLAS
ncbi:MAG TPA: hypothetical protein VFZ56_05585 [Gemmatimonadaceae bacterium]